MPRPKPSRRRASSKKYKGNQNARPTPSDFFRALTSVENLNKRNLVFASELEAHSFETIRDLIRQGQYGKLEKRHLSFLKRVFEQNKAKKKIA